MEGRAFLPPGTCVYAIGDVHGRDDLLARLLDMIAADADRRRPDKISVIVLGDFVDRGAWSRQVVERLMAGPPPGPLQHANWVCLKGNHEEVMLDFLADPATGRGWCTYGGIETVQSYCDGTAEKGWESDLIATHGILSRYLPDCHRRFMADLPLWHQEGDYLFVHAGIRPGVELDAQTARDLLWIRHEFLDDASWHGKVIVHGHTPADEPQSRPNRIGIDTRAYDSHRLTALVLWQDQRHFLHT